MTIIQKNLPVSKTKTACKKDKITAFMPSNTELVCLCL